MKRLIVSFFIVISLLFSSSTVHATSGCCSWHDGVSGCDGSVGRLVCNDGTYSPSCGCPIDPPPPTPPPAPPTTAKQTYYLNSSGGVDLFFDWDRPDNTQYSIAMTKYRGGDPGPDPDTTNSSITFTDVKPGRWYINLKEVIGGKWSTVTNWTVDVPQNVKTIAIARPTPTPFPTPTPMVSANNNSSTNSGGLIFVIVVIFGLIGLYLFYHAVAWLVQYAKTNEWVYTLLFWGVVIGGLWIYNLVTKDNTPTTNSTPKTQSKYSCNCSKTCPNLSCAEAQYQLNTCGCSVRDADDDGIACDAQCQ